VTSSDSSASDSAAKPAAARRSRRSRPAVSRCAIAPASTSDSSHAVRTISSHRTGAASPASDSGAAISTGSGFHDGPLEVSRPSCASSRPQTSHAHAS
jgi:hypothetical protein